MSMTRKKLEKAQLCSSIYDYFAAGIFAFPIFTAWYISNVLGLTHNVMGSVGQLPEFSAFHVLFANLFGGFAIMWSTLRIIKRDQPILGMCDGYLRLYYALMMCFYILYFDASRVLLIFIVIEFTWSSVQLSLYYKLKKEEGQNNGSLSFS